MLGHFERKFFIDFLRDVDEAQMSGILRLRQNRNIKALFFESGCLVFGISNLPDEELSQHLVNTGILSADNHQRLQPHINRTQPLTHLLQHYNLVSFNDLARAEHEVVTNMGISCFNWEGGEYTFDSSKTADHEFKTQIRALDILAEGIRRMRDDGYIANVIGDLALFVLPVSDIYARTKRINLNGQEGYIISKLDKPRTIKELISACGLPESDMLRSLYVMLATGVLDPLEERIDIRTSVRLAGVSGNQIRPVPLAPTASSPRASGAFRKLSPLDQDFSSLQTLQAAPLQAPRAAQAQPVSATAVPPKPPVEDTIKRAVSSSSKINTAKLEALAGIKIRSSAGPRDSEADEQAEQIFVQGKQALRVSDTKRAEALFKQAMDMVPDKAKYVLALALLLLKRPNARKEAEALLIRCCELEPGAVEPRLQLATIYEQSNMTAKAEQMYKSVLNIDPDNAIATQKLKKESSSIWNADVGAFFSKMIKK